MDRERLDEIRELFLHNFNGSGIRRNNLNRAITLFDRVADALGNYLDVELSEKAQELAVKLANVYDRTLVGRLNDTHFVEPSRTSFAAIGDGETINVPTPRTQEESLAVIQSSKGKHIKEVVCNKDGEVEAIGVDHNQKVGE